MIATASVEERCLAVHRRGVVDPARSRFLAIIDPDPPDRIAFLAAIEACRGELTNGGVPVGNVPNVDLLATVDDVVEQCEMLVLAGGGDVIIDVSAMPKRWFFLAVKMLLADTRVRSLVVAYTAARSYGDPLAENPGPLRLLPGFPGDLSSRYASVIVGIGFEPLGMTSLLSEITVDRIKLLFPFPPGPPGVARNWRFVKEIEEMTDDAQINPPDRVHIHMYDCPQVFDAIAMMTDGGRERTVLAPYGPKTLSLAMCLYAIAADNAGRPPVPVFYAQPTRYSLSYSTGVRQVAGEPDIQAFCLKVNGRSLYNIQPTS